MKTKITTIALIALTSFSNQLFAQEATSVSPSKASYDLKKNVKARVSQTDGNVTPIDDWQEQKAKIAQGQHIKSAILECRAKPTDDGCVVTLENKIVSPRDAASGLPTGKRMHKPISVHVSSSDNSITEVKSPRDAASGLATGKRMHKPTVLTMELGKSKPSSNSPKSDISVDEPGVQITGGAGAGKATFKEFTVTKRCAGKTTTIDCPNGECDIPLDDNYIGSCDLVCSWSWGMSNSGSSSSGSGMTGLTRSSVGFSLEIEDGSCTAMAINEKGLPGEKKPTKTKTNNPK
jgi:hypothetical protein